MAEIKVYFRHLAEIDSTLPYEGIYFLEMEEMEVSIWLLLNP